MSKHRNVDMRSPPRQKDPHVLRMQLCMALVGLDVAALALAFLCAHSLKPVGDSWFTILTVTILIYLGAALNVGAFGIRALRDKSFARVAAMRSLLLTFGALFLISYFFQAEQRLPRLLLIVTMISSAVFVLVVRRTVSALVARWWKDALIVELLVVDDVEPDVPLHLRRIDAAACNLVPDLRDPTMLDRFAQLTRRADRVVVACPASRRKNWAMMLKGVNILGEIMVDDMDAIGAIGLSRYDRHTTLTVAAGPLDPGQRIAKRLFDLALCVPALIALAPLLVLVAIAVKIDSPGPVLFRQRRVGRSNAFFEIMKFRSMHVTQNDSDGNLSTQRRDKRVTRIGNIIRRTSIDELPQLFNVLFGSMSLVGPRPHALGSMAGDHLFWDVDERYWHRHVLKPGITGLAQVRGFRGATHQREDLTGRLQADLEYAAEWSIRRDVSILLATFKVIVHHNTY